ncbi:MAG: metallophosphoesterase [Clostridia bacterium]|nr:metallophosphoesterase [Clostridia bacterium]
MFKNHSPITVNVISDIHYYSKKVGVSGEAFEKVNAKTANDLVNTEEILEKLINQLGNDSESDIVLVSGDVTRDGEPDSHMECIALLKKLQTMGKKVYVITATHDYRDGNQTDSYTENGVVKIETYPREKLLELYWDFGPSEAIALHKKSMSYIVQLPGNYRLFALNDDSNLNGASGFSEELWAWIEEQVKDAEKNGQFIIPMTHHPMISPSPFYKIIGGGNMMGEHEKRRAQFADLGISFMLTGHTHIQDISYCFSEKGNVFYDITTAAPIAYPGTYRKLVINPAEEKIEVKAVEINGPFPFEMKGKTLKEHLEKKFFGMIGDVISCAATDTNQLAKMVSAFSIKPELIFKIGWLIRPFAKILNALKIKHVARICKKESGLKKEDWQDIGNERVVDFIISLVSNLYGGDSPYSPSTAYYKITMAVCSILDSLLKTVGVKIGKLVKGFNSVGEIVEPLLYNNGICDETAVLKLYPLKKEKGEAPIIVQPQEKPEIKSSKKGLGIIILAVLLVLILLIPILLWLGIGFVCNQIKFRKELKNEK